MMNKTINGLEYEMKSLLYNIDIHVTNYISKYFEKLFSINLRMVADLKFFTLFAITR